MTYTKVVNAALTTYELNDTTKTNVHLQAIHLVIWYVLPYCKQDRLIQRNRHHAVGWLQNGLQGLYAQDERCTFHPLFQTWHNHKQHNNTCTFAPLTYIEFALLLMFLTQPLFAPCVSAYEPDPLSRPLLYRFSFFAYVAQTFLLCEENSFAWIFQSIPLDVSDKPVFDMQYVHLYALDNTVGDIRLSQPYAVFYVLYDTFYSVDEDHRVYFGPCQRTQELQGRNLDIWNIVSMKHHEDNQSYPELPFIQCALRFCCQGDKAITFSRQVANPTLDNTLIIA